MPDLRALTDILRTAPVTSWGLVGHADGDTHAWTAGGAVRVAVTLTPSGEEIVATMPDGGGGAGFLVWMPVWPGMRVLVLEVGDEWVVAGRFPDTSRPQDATIDGLPGFVEDAAAPSTMFLRTPSGTMLSISTDDGSDVLITSGGSIRLRVGDGEQVLIEGETHIGGAFSSAPSSAIADGDTLTPGVGGGAFVPTPATNPTLPPPVAPADGIVRVKDRVQSNAAIDEAFWTWVGTVTAVLAQYVALMNTGPGIPVLTLGPGSLIPPVPIITLESLPMSGATSTCED